VELPKIGEFIGGIPVGGAGIIFGPASDGLVGLDFDGEAAAEMVAGWGVELPPTIQVTSGRPGRSLLIYRIPEEYWGLVRTTVVSTGLKGSDQWQQDFDQHLELRWTGSQSVIQGIHPLTEQPYQILNWVDNVPEMPVELIRRMMATDPGSKPAQTQSSPTPTGDPIPLINLMAVEHRRLTETGVAEGGRNNTCHRIASDAYGCQQWAAQTGILIEGSWVDLIQQFADRCVPPIAASEVETIIGSVERSKPTPCLSVDKLIGCVSAHQRRSKVVPISAAKGDRDPRLKPEKSLREAITQGIQECQSKSQTSQKILELVKEFGLPARDIRQLWEEISTENDDQPDPQKLDTLINLSNQRVDLPLVLGDPLAGLLLTKAQAMSVPVEALLTTLLPVVGSLIGTRSEIMLDPAKGYNQPAIIRSAIVANTGDRKTPLMRSIIKPLEEWQRREWESHKAIKEDYKAALKHWEKSPKGDRAEPPNEPPAQRRFVIAGGSYEGRIRVHLDNPDGLLDYTDELIGRFNRQNQYRNGNGDDAQNDLSEFNGGSLTRDKVGSSDYLPKSGISCTGSIQWGALQKLQEKLGPDDDAGSLARWLFCAVPIPPAIWERNRSKVEDPLPAYLDELYQQIRNQPKQQYLIDDHAWAIFAGWHNQLEEKRKAETLPALAAYYPKIESYTARFCLLLHCLDAAVNNATPTQWIPGSVMKRAKHLAVWYLSQYYLLLSKTAQDSGEGIQIKILELLERKGSLTVRDIKMSTWSLRKTPASEIKSLMAELAELGKATLKGSKLYPGGGVEDVHASINKTSTWHQHPQQTKDPVTQTVPYQGSNIPQPLDRLENVDVVDAMLMPSSTSSSTPLNPYPVIISEIDDESVDVVDGGTPSNRQNLVVNNTTCTESVNRDQFLPVFHKTPSTTSTPSTKPDPVPGSLASEIADLKRQIQARRLELGMSDADFYAALREALEAQDPNLSPEEKDYFAAIDLLDWLSTPPTDPEPDPEPPTPPTPPPRDPDPTPPPDPRSLIQREGSRLLIDEESLDLGYQPQNRIPDWQPSTTLKPWESLRRVHLDIETTGLDPKVDRVIAVGLLQGQGEPITLTDPDEATLLRETLAALNRLDPEVVLTYNGISFDLPFLLERCRQHGIRCPWRLADRTKRIQKAQVFGKPLEFTPIYWRGVEVVDCYHLVLIHDSVAAKLDSYSLKRVPEALGLRTGDRQELSHQEIQECWRSGDLETLLHYLKDDLTDTQLIADYLCPVVHYQRLIVPGVSLQDLAVMGSASKWQRVMGSLYPGVEPLADERSEVQGGLTEGYAGLFKDCAKLDVSSLYPSLMLNYQITTRKDPDLKLLGVLRYLTDERLRLKKLAKGGDQQADQTQGALKVLINSAYGFLGTGGIPHNDYEAAALVTAYGRAVLRRMMAGIQEQGGFLVEVDTDGVIFSHKDPVTVADTVQAMMPPGINLDLEFTGSAVYIPANSDGSGKRKNYLIFHPNGKITTKGSYRKRDRSVLERDWAVEFLKLWIQDPQVADQFYLDTLAQIETGSYPVENLAITRRIRANEKELLQFGNPGDKITFWQGANKRKVNEGGYSSDHYSEKLRTIHGEIRLAVDPSWEDPDKPLTLF
jgi:DNA polymerase III epsilon subunit-like protein